MGRSRGVGTVHDNVGTSIEEGLGRFLLKDWIVPGVDPAHVDCTFRAGYGCAKGEGVTKAKLFWDGEGRHVAKFWIAVSFSPGASNHTVEVFHCFHGAKEVAKVFAVGFEAADVDEVDVGEFARNDFGWIHVAK